MTKEERFVLEYQQDGNGAAAAVRAGYAPKSAKVTASRLLTKANVKAALDKAREISTSRAQLLVDYVLGEVRLLAHSDITHYTVNDSGDVQLTQEAPLGAMRAIRSLKRRVITTKDGKTTRETELTLWDKVKSLELEGSNMSLWKQVIDLPSVPLFANGLQPSVSNPLIKE